MDRNLQRLLRTAKASGQLVELFAETVDNLPEDQLEAARDYITKILRHQVLRTSSSRVWVTKDKRRIPIKELEDEHLLSILHCITTYAVKKHSNFMKNLIQGEALRRKLILPTNPPELQ